MVNFHQKTILLIEDDLFIRELYQRTLTKEGYTVLTAGDGEQGIQLVSQHPDLILLDLMLPKKNGIDVLKEIKADPETAIIPVIILTNLGDQSMVNELKTLGAVGYIVKAQFTPQQIVEHVAKYLETSNTSR